MLERGLELCQSGNMPRFVPDIAAFLGAALALSGRVSEALPLLEEAVQQGDTMRFMAWHALRVVHLGEAYLGAGRVDEALTQSQRALELARTHKQHGYQAYALRLLGEIARHGNPPDPAEAETPYRQALDLADELGMRPLQAHCHRGLGVLYSQTGQAEQARAELTTAIDMYRDMEMTFWLPETEVVLAAVEGR
jgi:tetratricopeptide (TPR) repeat protein